MDAMLIVLATGMMEEDVVCGLKKVCRRKFVL
jgi:hypothetical protein